MPVPLEVFCCYAREDQEMLEHLKKHLMPLQRSGQITVWSDTNLNAGVEWEKELHQHLESADLILLLVSPDFMSSDYCYSTEMKRALERHAQGKAQVIPILLRPVHWEMAPFAKLQMIPTNATPVTKWPNRDDAFHDVTGHINHFLSGSQKEKQVPTKRLQEVLPPLSPSLHSSNQILQPEPSTHLASLQNRPVASIGNQQTISFPSLPLAEKPGAIGVLRTFTGQKKDIPNIALGDNGKILASAGLDRTIRLWDVQTGQQISLPPETKKLRMSMNMALSADGNALAYAYYSDGDENFHVCVWDVQATELVRDTLCDYHQGISNLLLSADGQVLVVSDLMWYDHREHLDVTDNSLAIYTVYQDQPPLYPFEDKSFISFALNASGLTLVASREHSLYVCNTQTGQVLCSFYDEKLPALASMALNSDGSLLAGGNTDGTVKVWSVQKNKLKLLRTFSCATKSLALSQDGLTLACASYREKKILLWNTKSGKLLGTLQSPTGTVSSIALSADGRVLASGCSDGTIHVWGIKP
jgi:WD40 repeat protein